jgi:hypothetical protein
MSRAADIINSLGGPAKIAEVTPHKAGTVSLWKHRGIIPRRAWPDLIDAFPGKVSMSALRAAEPPKNATAA